MKCVHWKNITGASTERVCGSSFSAHSEFKLHELYVFRYYIESSGTTFNSIVITLTLTLLHESDKNFYTTSHAIVSSLYFRVLTLATEV